MKTVIKYLKRSLKTIAIIIVLLVIQAICDLSLPQYTSDIVNVGIQQNGISDISPFIIRDSELTKLKLFLNDDEKKFVDENYVLLDKKSLTDEKYDSYVKKYPALINEPLYERRDDISKDELEKLDDIFGEPILIVWNFTNNPDSADGFINILKSQVPYFDMAINEDSNVFEILSLVPEEYMSKIRESLNSEFKNMSELLISQSGIAYVKEEYSKIGINMNNVQQSYIFNTGMKMIFTAFIGGISIVLVSLLASKTAALLAQNLRKDVFKKVVGFSNIEFDRFSTASLITRTTNDIQQIQTFVVMMLRMIFYAPILGIGGLVKVLQTERSMTWIIGVALASILVLISLLFGTTMPKFKKVQLLIDKLNGVAREILIGVPVIRAFTNEKFEEERFDKANVELTRTNLSVNRVMTGMMPAMMLIMNSITVLIVWVGGKQIDDGLMQVGNLMAFIQYTMQIVMSFLLISMVSVMLPRALVSANRIGEVLNTEYAVKDIAKPLEFEDDKKGTVEFKDVSFKYPDSSDYALKDISFSARKGEVTAIIGSTGSGKTTLVNLIPRLFDVTSGEILVDGVDIKDVSQHKLREKIGFVPQKGVLFSGTILSNIMYGKLNASMEEVNEASEIAMASEFINRKDKKYDTEISQGGTNVSGGQKQRLSIARAIIKDPEIMIFDDSFSALDYKTDAALRNKLRKKKSESTKIVVAQRISTVMDAGEIIVLEKGRIVGIGTHDELLKTCEPYKQIALSQLSKEELGIKEA